MTPIMVENLDQAEAWQGQADGGPLPIGDHVAVIDAVEEGVTSNKSPQLIITWRGLHGAAQGCTSREWLVVLPQTLGKVRAFLEAIGYPIQSGSFALPTTQLVGRRCQIIVREATYGGKTMVKVMGHLPYSGVAAGGEVPISTVGLPAPTVPAASAVADNDPLPFRYRPGGWDKQTNHNPFA